MKRKQSSGPFVVLLSRGIEELCGSSLLFFLALWDGGLPYWDHKVVSCWRSPCLDSQGWRQDTACPSVLAPVTSMPREGLLLGIYVLFPYQPARGLCQITFVSQSNTHFLKSQPLLDLWLWCPDSLAFGRMRLLLRLAEVVVLKILAKNTQRFAPERLQLW